MVKQRRSISNSCSKPIYGTFLVLAICFITFLTMPTVLGFEFDNVKSYNEITREVTIHNTFLGYKLNEVGKARLNTPLNVKVGVGYQKVAEFDLWAYEDYSDALKQFTFEDMNNGKKKINRDYDLKYLTHEDVEINDYETECLQVLNIKNNSYYDECERILIGSHFEKKEVWIKITPANLKKNEKLTIGVFTDVQQRDYIDWIPMIYGVEVDEWATWTNDLNVGLLNYYKLDETPNPIIDSVENANGINYGATSGVTGKINNSYSFVDDDFINMGSYFPNGLTNFTIGFWMNTTTQDQSSLVYNNGNGSNTFEVRLEDTGALFVFMRDTEGDDIVITSSNTDNDDGDWRFVVVRKTGTTATLFVNNVSVGTDTDASLGAMDLNDGINLTMGGRDASTLNYDGLIDEIFFYNRSLLQTEITQIYNEGDGITYEVTGDISPQITLNSPTSTNYTTSPQNLQINFTAWDDVNLTDVKLYINDVLNQTNASGINNTNYLFNLTLIDGNYTIYGKATDNESQETNSSSIQINIDTTPNIHFVSPTQIDNYNSSSSIIPINVNLTETYFQNITFNVNGTEYFYTDGTRAINYSYADGTYDYNVTTCTTTNKCNTTETRTINIDAGKILTLDYPENDTIISNDTITFITTLNSSDTSEEWINITYYLWNSDGLVNNETNIISGFNLTNNVTFTNLTLRDYYWNALAWYGNPTHKDYIWGTGGNFTFSIGATVSNETYSNETYETATDVFSINTTLFEGVVVHAAYLYYDSVKYIGEITDLENNQYLITKSLDIPLINGEAENRSFYWSFIYTSPIQKTQNTTTRNQTVSPIFFTLCDANYTVHALDISIKEEGTFDDLNGTLEFAADYWLGSGDIVKEYTYSYLENNISSYDFCISPSDETFNIDDIISYTATDYDRRDYFLDNAELSNATMNLSLYLSSTATTDIFTITVQDQDSKPVEGAFVNVQRWDIGTNNFYTIGMIKTTSDGTGIINSRLNDAWYRYQVTYNELLYLTTEPVKEAGTSRTLKINLEADNPYDRFGDIDYSLTYDETTNISTFTYADTTGAVAIGCLKVLKMEGNGTIEVYYSCTESTSGTLSYQIGDDGTYIIRAIFQLSSTYNNIEQVVDEIIVQGTNIRFITIGKFGQFISLMLVGTASMLGIAIGSIPLGLGLIATSLIIVNLLGWLNITSSVLYGIISIIILIGLNLRRGR